MRGGQGRGDNGDIEEQEMTAILLLVVFITWLCTAIWLSSRIARHIVRPVLRLSAASGSFAVRMLLPLADEIVGGMQFRMLCKKTPSCA